MWSDTLSGHFLKVIFVSESSDQLTVQQLKKRFEQGTFKLTQRA